MKTAKPDPVTLSGRAVRNLEAVIYVLGTTVAENRPTDPRILHTWLKTSRDWIDEALKEVVDELERQKNDRHPETKRGGTSRPQCPHCGGKLRVKPGSRTALQAYWQCKKCLVVRPPGECQWTNVEIRMMSGDLKLEDEL